MKRNFFFLTAVGSDKPGLVARVTHELYVHGCNLEDSSMMRLGSEFGMFAIFTAPAAFSPKRVKSKLSTTKLSVSIESISKRDALFRKSKSDVWIVRVHGADRPGLVYEITRCLARNKFNITDLATHRTDSPSQPGYILFIEGEPARGTMQRLGKQLAAIGRALSTKLSFEPVSSSAL